MRIWISPLVECYKNKYGEVLVQVKRGTNRYRKRIGTAYNIEVPLKAGLMPRLHIHRFDAGLV